VTTVGALIRAGARALTRARVVFGHGYAGARDEAAALVCHALHMAPACMEQSRIVSEHEAQRARTLIAERIATRRPAAYLTHTAWQNGVRFYVDERVLTPRSYIAELIAEDDILLPAHPRRVLDLCTGSGCLAILLAKRYRRAQIDATDVSRDALAVAAINVRRHRLEKRCKLLFSNVFSRLNRKRYDLLVSNPPYVRGAVMNKLPAEYRHEPALALAASDDGLDLIRKILAQAATHLNPGGVLVVECGHARERVERAWPRLPFLWPETSGGDDCVFVLTREELLAGLRAGRSSPIAQRSKRRT
jgi:ribosomal protein L3 glutamine methyltransferase